ncbi:type II toxin-antitoxin system RelE/ParE family toxin [Aliterella atlantica]|uniref:type II toxin-antitoxin system RelE/ParE family toxin n=1 Tax=Aliterella atlantica TaxID=1827278 RepID=UPI00190FCE02|nr:type II toxin-antitoxin system RelE/ParE family toxin [Aliterella atlantica]
MAKFPNIGRSYNYISLYLRGLPLNGYIILYQVVDDGVNILRVVNGRQDLEALFAED